VVRSRSFLRLSVSGVCRLLSRDDLVVSRSLTLEELNREFRKGWGSGEGLGCYFICVPRFLATGNRQSKLEFVVRVKSSQ